MIPGSGVSKIAYSVDGEVYKLYAGPFKLSSYSDGRHVIAYRSIDKVMNTETEKTFSLILDSTPPETTISASDELYEGGINTVSPRTRFFLDAADSGTGVKKIEYRIDKGIWSEYLAGFPLPGVAGSHAIDFKAIDNLGNEDVEKMLTVNMIVIEVTKEVSTDPVVLAGAWGSTPSTQTAITNLTSILSASGLSYYIPASDAEFKEALRSGRYNTFLLVDFDTEGLIDELKEAVNYGDGLVYIKTKSDDEHDISELFGVQFNGMSTNKDMVVNLTESEISHIGTMQSTGKAVKTTITASTAESLGTVTDKKDTYPVVVSNEYGKGKGVLFAFDLLNSPDQTKVKDLVINSINYVMPAETYARAMAGVPVTINIQNSTELADLQITESLPLNTSADTVIPSAITSGNTITWQFNVGANGHSPLSYWLNLPDTAGEYLLGTELNYSNQGNYRLYGNYELSVTVFQNSSELLAEVITELQGLQVSKSDAGHVSNALAYLELVKDTTTVTKADAQNNIDYILSALKELEKVSVDVSAIRLQLGELLKIWQAKWNLAPVALAESSRYRLVYDGDDRKITKHNASKCHSVLPGILLSSSFPRTVGGLPAGEAGNPEGRCSKTFLLASAGSTSQLLNSSTTNDVLYFYHTDHLGTPIMMTDKDQHIVWEGEFMPFGEEYSITGTITNNLRFPGQYYDEETGLSQNWHRDYKPEVGRYIEKDPVGFQGGLNLYVYGQNNPQSLADPSGERISVFTRSLDTKITSGPYVHCVLVVEKCDDKKQTWDFQYDNNVYNPAKLPANPIKNPNTTVVYSGYDKDDLVAFIANEMSHPNYSKTKYNCCYWVEDVLAKAGISWKNPNPWPAN